MLSSPPVSVRVKSGVPRLETPPTTGAGAGAGLSSVFPLFALVGPPPPKYLFDPPLVRGVDAPPVKLSVRYNPPPGVGAASLFEPGDEKSNDENFGAALDASPSLDASPRSTPTAPRASSGVVPPYAIIASLPSSLPVPSPRARGDVAFAARALASGVPASRSANGAPIGFGVRDSPPRTLGSTKDDPL